MSRHHLRREAAAAIAVVGMAAACSSGATTVNTSAGSGTQVQALASLAFSPTSVAVPVGATVTWVFGSVAHTVTFDAVAGRPADIGTAGAANANVSIARTFATAGAYTYHCSIHPSMIGSVVVGNVVAPPPPPPPPPPPYGSPPGYRTTP